MLLPSFLQGEDSFEVSERLEAPIHLIAQGTASILGALMPVPSPDSRRSSIPVILATRSCAGGFHAPALLGALYDALVTVALETDTDEESEDVMARLTGLYRECLAHPWGVLCALPIEAQCWIYEGALIKGQLSPERIQLLLEAVTRERDWLRSMDGRYEDGGEKPGHLWEAHTVVSWLAARHGLPAPTSQITWDQTVQELHERL